jgi:hypothetical protein
MILSCMSNYRLPIRIEILSSAENVSSLDNDLHKILVEPLIVVNTLLLLIRMGLHK